MKFFHTIRESIVFCLVVFVMLSSELFADNILQDYLKNELKNISESEQRTLSYNAIRVILEKKFKNEALEDKLKDEVLKKARLALLSMKNERLSGDYLAIALSFYANDGLYESENISHFIALWKNDEQIPKNLAISADYNLFLNLVSFLKEVDKNETFAKFVAKAVNKNNNNILFLSTKIDNEAYFINFNKKQYTVKHENFIPLEQNSLSVVILKQDCTLAPQEIRDTGLELFSDKKCFEILP